VGGSYWGGGGGDVCIRGVPILIKMISDRGNRQSRKKGRKALKKSLEDHSTRKERDLLSLSICGR